MPPAMFFAWNFYRFRGNEISFSRLLISSIILSLTVIVTSLQFIYPQVIPALNRNPDALASGELWRLITPLFIQPGGLWQCLFNFIFFISFVPLAEHFYRRKVLLIYFATGVIGQVANFYWMKTGGALSSLSGGSSTAIFGVMGSLFMYILIFPKDFPKLYLLLSLAGFTGATILCFFKDGHAPSLLAGGLLSWITTLGRKKPCINR